MRLPGWPIEVDSVNLVRQETAFSLLTMLPKGSIMPTTEVPAPASPVLRTPHETATRLHTTYGTLAVWRNKRNHALRYTKIGTKVFYLDEDIDAYIRSCGVPGTGPKPDHRKVVRRRKAGK